MIRESWLTAVSHQALLDVADVCEKVADGCDLEQSNKQDWWREKRSEKRGGRKHPAGGLGYPSSAGRGDVVVAALVAQLDAMLAQVRHAA